MCSIFIGIVDGIFPGFACFSAEEEGNAKSGKGFATRPD
jgi:hypothetical protein